MARWTKKLIAQQLAWTDVCYRRALLDHYDHLFTEEERDYDTPEMTLILQEHLKVKHVTSPELNTTYLKYICELETDKLELIVEAYNKGKQYRSASTIDVLLSELFERSANPETRSKHE